MDLRQFMPEPISIVGVDLGQRQDYTAVSVIERHLVPAKPGEIRAGSRLRYVGDGYVPEECAVIPVRREYHCRHLERYRDVPYPDVIEDLLGLVDAVDGDRVLVVDATGVGLPIFDNLYRALSGSLDPRDERETKLVGVLIHGGDRVTPPKRGVVGVPKRDLVGVSQVLLESKRLKVAEGLELKDTLLEELRNFKIKIDPKTAHDSYSHWREADHDDLVLSVALACWIGEARLRKQDQVQVPNHIPGYLVGEPADARGMWGS
jgi:hypothetical protein